MLWWIESTFSSLFNNAVGVIFLSAFINSRCASVAKWATWRLMKEKKKRYFPAPLCCIETASCSLAMTEWPSEGMWSSPVTECIYLPCDTDMHLSLAELKGEGEMVHSTWIAILPVTARDPGSSMLGLLCDCTVTVLPQSLLGWPTFFFYCKGCAHLLTFFPPSLSLPFPPEGDKLPRRLSNLGIWTRSTRLVSPSFPRAQLESSLNRLHCRDDRRLRGANRQVWSLWKKQQL